MTNKSIIVQDSNKKTKIKEMKKIIVVGEKKC
jgi:hypothetical protein